MSTAHEQRYKIGKALAKQFSMRPESFRAALVAAGCVLERPGLRGTFIAESELNKFIAWSRSRASGSRKAS